jgi:quercetin dioxygenase-like cupin family protein
MAPRTDTETWEWPESLDALVAAPGFHTLLFENDDVRVLDTRIGPGETVPVHTHRWPAALYVLSAGHFVRRDGEGSILTDPRAAGALLAPGAAIWIEALPPHTLENVAGVEIRVINIELKRP